MSCTCASPTKCRESTSAVLATARSPRCTRTCSAVRWDRVCTKSCVSSAVFAIGSTESCGDTTARLSCRSAAACVRPMSPRSTRASMRSSRTSAQSGPIRRRGRPSAVVHSGTAALAFESTRACADHAVELIMEYGDHDVDPRAHLTAIESVTRADLTELAAQVEPGPCVGCVGPVELGRLFVMAQPARYCESPLGLEFTPGWDLMSGAAG